MKLTGITYTYRLDGEALKPAELVREVMIDGDVPNEITVFEGVAHVTYLYSDGDEEDL